MQLELFPAVAASPAWIAGAESLDKWREGTPDWQQLERGDAIEILDPVTEECFGASVLVANPDDVLCRRDRDNKQIRVPMDRVYAYCYSRAA